jgi:hypothetical protein
LEVSDRQSSAESESGLQASAAYEQCERCAAPVERAQRYCVECGAHRRHVPDPTARYLATGAARARTVSAAVRRPGRGRQRSHGLGVALALAVIPLAVGLGVLVGRAATSGDSTLMAALRAQKPEVITTAAGAGTAATPAATSLTSTRGRRRAARASAGAGKVLSTSAFGAAHQITGSKPNAAQLAAGAQVVRHIQQTQGKSYVNAQRGLPDQISVP